MSTKQLDILARNAISQDKKLAPRSLAKIVWALAALGYDPTPKDLAALKDRSAHAMPEADGQGSGGVARGVGEARRRADHAA